MRWSKTLIPTLKEDPAEAEVISHKLLVRAGFIRQISRGIYDYLPLALKVLRRIEEIVREEMNRAGAQELLLPIASPAELWQESGRWEMYGKELLRFKDRHERDFCLGPTHEEVITDLVRRTVRSYRDLPLNLYQIQIKFRDEVRPRFGLMRGREFIMKDAYSFHADVDDCRREYQNMFAAYKRIFNRFGLRFRPVEADTGAIGGTQSHEFQVLADSGEDAVASCAVCEYAANVEKAEIGAPRRPTSTANAAAPAALKKVPTPGKKSVSEVAEFLRLPVDSFIKTLVYSCDGSELVAVLVRGDHEINETKLKTLLGCREVVLADDASVRSATGVPPGFLGPVGMRLRVVADYAVAEMRDAVTGANEPDTHYVGVDQRRDFTVTTFADLRLARAGDPCPRCESGLLEIHRGIEVGQVFYLGTKYSQAMGANYLDAEGRERPLEMGCYGIGISRLMAAAIEQNHDANGIIWPFAIAPAHVLLLPVNYRDKSLQEVCDRLYEELQRAGVDVLFDDRDERPGVKFKDGDLVGIPLRITVGPKGLEKGYVELRWRRDGRNENLPVNEAAERIRRIVAEELGAT